MASLLSTPAGQARVPERAALEHGLRCALAAGGGKRACEVIDRQPLDHASTFPSEILTCVIDGCQARVLAKYGGVVAEHADHGARGCVPYEAHVYRQLLPRLHMTVPQCVGVYEDAATGQVWLFLEYLEDSQRIQKMSERVGLEAAAAWAGRFHAAADKLTPPAAPLIRYDEAFYAGWVQRTLEFAGEWRRQLPWLEPLCERATDVLRWLLIAPTVIHGEFYPQNVLVRGNEIYPVDWESAAVGAGEIDLAMLTEGWPEEVIRSCTQAYCLARWSGAPSPEFERRLLASRLYSEFRWLGSRPGWTAYPRGQARFAALRRAGEAADLVKTS